MTYSTTTTLARCGLFLLLGASTPSVLAQTTYYVAANGNDAYDGRSSNQPFQSLAKVNTVTLQPGDQVLFRRGDTFRGSLQLRQSGSASNPIVIDAFGSGAKPVISGSQPLTNWANLGNNRWQATCSSCGDRVTGLYRDNAALPLGRYPNLSDSNRGYLTVQSHSGKTQLTSQQGLSTNWSGGEAVFRPVQWILNRAAITGQNGNTLSLDGSGSYDVGDNWGYFIQNHPATLDQTGEWYYNPANKTILLYDSQANPNGQTIAATVSAEAMKISDLSFVTVRNLQITQALATGLLVNNGSNVVITNNDITQSGEDGVLVQGNGQQVVLENNLIEDINNNGVTIGNYQNVTFRGNTVRRIGLIPGRGKSGDGTYIGFRSSSNANTLIENNVLDNIGYNALNFATSTVIQRNQISNFCLTKSDGSGIYIWNGNKEPLADIRIVSNIVYNGIGAPEGTPGGAYSGANGIYLDDCTTNMEVTGNSVYNCRGLGYYLHGSSNIRLTGNTAYNNGEGQLAITSADGCQPRSNVIQNNVFVSRVASQFNVKYESNQNDLGSFGQFDNNVYARPFDDTYVIRAVYNRTTGADLSLAQWKSQYGKDQSTTGSPVTYSSGNPDDYIRFIVNPTGNATQTSLDGTYRDMKNNVYTNQMTVAAFSSIVLLKEPAATPLRDPENPANTTAGLDYAYYEGSWGNLPNFASLTPIKTGTTNTPSVALRNREDNFGLRFTGYINVPADGVYTFYSSSDDGSKLLIGSTEVVNNDGGHAEQERSGTIGLKAGVHALSVLYFQGTGGQVLTLSYSGPNLGKQVIPTGSYLRVATNTPVQPPVSSLRDPENPANTTAGLDYAYYEGSWGNLPNFGSLTPIKTGTTNTPSVALRNREDNFGLRFTGYINVPTDGVYTFYSSSDDGSKLLIGSTEVVNNDGGHAEQERSGTIGLKAGVHALSVLYFQGTGGQVLTLSYSGPNLGKQVIPTGSYLRVATNTPVQPPVSSLRDPENPANTTAGLDYAYYEGSWGNLPNFGSLTPIKTGTTNTPSVALRNREDNFGLRFTGYINVPTDGVYTFYSSSDDGSKLLIGSTEVVNNDGGHAEQERSGTIGLKAGVHALSVLYFQGTGGQVLTLSYSGPNLGKQVIPTGSYLRVATNTPVQPPVVGGTGTGTGLRADYFNNKDLNAPVVLSRIDASVNFDWGDGSPASNINVDNFSARWMGQVEAPASGNYIFSTASDDGIRLWVNGNLVIDNWTGHPVTINNSPSIALTAGQKYDIRLEYFEGPGGAVAKLLWTYPGQGQQAIPQIRLYPSAGSGRLGATVSQEITVEELIVVYPVPARDEVRVRYRAEEAGTVGLQLVSESGQIVLKSTEAVMKGANELRLGVSTLPRGLYVLSVIENHKRLSRKIILAD